MTKAGKKGATGGVRRVVRAGKTRPPVAQKAPWWLIANTEMCMFCLQNYAYGTGYRCARCDAAVCAFCVEIRGGEYCCPEC